MPFHPYAQELLSLGAFALLYLLGSLAYRYPDRYVGTRHNETIPGPKGLPILGNTFHVFIYRKRMLTFMDTMHQLYGHAFTFTMPAWGRTIVISRPEWLQHIKKRDISSYSRGDVAISIFRQFPGVHTPVSSEGRDWRISRRMMHPIFTVTAFTTHVSKAMAEIIPTARELLKAVSEADLAVDWNDIAGRISLNIFLKSAMNTGTNTLRGDLACLQESNLITDAIVELNQISAGRLFNPYWSITERFDGRRSRFFRARAAIWDIVEKMIEDRKASGTSLDTAGPTDFLSALLADPSVKNPLLIRDTLVTLLFAGRDNTQNSLAWSLYELSRHPEWLARMREETATNDKNGQVLEYEDVACYPVHLAVFYETVRLWPGLPKNARFALEDDVLPEIPELGLPAISVSKGDYVLWSDYAIMRDEKVWGKHAQEFNPGRHLSEKGHFIQPTQPNFIGFGSGARHCPASQLVAYQFVAIWVGLLPSLEFVPVVEKERYMVDAFTATMADGFQIKVKPRS